MFFPSWAVLSCVFSLEAVGAVGAVGRGMLSEGQGPPTSRASTRAVSPPGDVTPDRGQTGVTG